MVIDKQGGRDLFAAGTPNYLFERYVVMVLDLLALRKSNWNPAQRLINKSAGTSGWHRQDFRRSGATLLGELGVMPDIVEAALNHVAIHSPLTATYNQSRYRPQVADALKRLADHLRPAGVGKALGHG